MQGTELMSFHQSQVLIITAWRVRIKGRNVGFVPHVISDFFLVISSNMKMQPKCRYLHNAGSQRGPKLFEINEDLCDVPVNQTRLFWNGDVASFRESVTANIADSDRTRVESLSKSLCLLIIRKSSTLNRETLIPIIMKRRLCYPDHTVTIKYWLRTLSVYYYEKCQNIRLYIGGFYDFVLTIKLV